ncbi:MAG: hypothetical protein IJJ33_07175, partial [Victivallales bacterium]|nr:hypothetical protein [Victivallales bacterium]
RIQVEHPVTESVVRRDLVREQLGIALGGELSFTQDDVHPRGYAMEARVTAENVARRFAPSPGHVSFFLPPGGPGIRVDTHLFSGCDIPPFYDSLLGKVIAYGDTRQEALERLRRAIGEFWVVGVATNVLFLKHLLALPEFVDGTYDTESIEREIGRLDASEMDSLASCHTGSLS